MRRFTTAGATALLAVPLLLSGCSRDPGPAPAGAAPASPTRSYHYAGRGAFSRLEQHVEPSGGQRLKGDTFISSGVGAAGARSVRLVESATLDASGRLQRADICRTVSAVQEVCFRLDAASGTVRIERAGAEAFEWRVPVDAPWVYQGSSREGGELVSTPLAGWVALRAASGGEVVRVIDPGRQRSLLVPVDQVAVATEKGTTVVLDGDAIDVSHRFVEEVRLLDRGTSLTLLPPPADPGS